MYLRTAPTGLSVHNDWRYQLALLKILFTDCTILAFIYKPKVVSRSESQKLTTLFSLQAQCPATPGKVSEKQDRAILPK